MSDKFRPRKGDWLKKKTQSPITAKEKAPKLSSLEITPDQGLYTAQEAMAYLRVSKSSFYRLLRSGVLKTYELPFAGKRFKKEDLDAALRPVNPDQIETGEN